MARQSTANGQYVSFLGGPDTTGSWSLSAWVRADHDAAQVVDTVGVVVWFAANSAHGEVGLYWDHSTAAYVAGVAMASGDDSWPVAYWGPASADTWYAVCATYNSATEDLLAYRDGGLITTTASAPVNAVGSTGPIYLGGADFLEAGSGYGVAEVAWWDAVLTATEIAALAKGVCPFRVRRGSLLFYAPVWGSHSPELDFGPSHLSGTVVGLAKAPHPPVSWLGRRQDVTIYETGTTGLKRGQLCLLGVGP